MGLWNQSEVYLDLPTFVDLCCTSMTTGGPGAVGYAYQVRTAILDIYDNQVHSAILDSYDNQVHTAILDKSELHIVTLLAGYASQVLLQYNY